jgi:hypothetical protein
MKPGMKAINQVTNGQMNHTLPVCGVNYVLKALVLQMNWQSFPQLTDQLNYQLAAISHPESPAPVILPLSYTSM